MKNSFQGRLLMVLVSLLIVAVHRLWLSPNYLTVHARRGADPPEILPAGGALL